MGYDILLRLLERTGDREGYERTARDAEALRRKLDASSQQDNNGEITAP